jgi:hypothetical protein
VAIMTHGHETTASTGGAQARWRQAVAGVGVGLAANAAAGLAGLLLVVSSPLWTSGGLDALVPIFMAVVCILAVLVLGGAIAGAQHLRPRWEKMRRVPSDRKVLGLSIILSTCVPAPLALLVMLIVNNR